MSKVDLAVWRRPAHAVCQVHMTTFSCFALHVAPGPADMKPVYSKSSRGRLAFTVSVRFDFGQFSIKRDKIAPLA
jgi:hypothetical protein